MFARLSQDAHVTSKHDNPYEGYVNWILTSERKQIWL